MATFDLSGVGSSGGSGIDVVGFVEQILFAERAPARLLENQLTLLNAQSAAASDINAKLLDLQSKIDGLNDPLGQFNSRQISSSDDAVVTASVDASALAASHIVTVNSLATTSSQYSNQYADGASKIKDGSFDLTVGTGPKTKITIDETNNTLEGLAAHITSLDLGVRASVITDADGARLSLVSEASGAPGDLKISGVMTTDLDFTKAVTGTNADLTVNGIPISSATNTINTVVSGVTFNLLSASASPVTLTVTEDTAAAKQSVNDFVTAYNEVVSAINSQFTYDAATGNSPPLFGDSALRIVQQNLLSSIGYSIADNNGFETPGSIGINMSDDGTLSVDDSKLEAAVSANYDDVKNFFQSSSPEGFALSLQTMLDGLTDSLDGPLNTAIKGFNETSLDVTRRVEDFDSRLEFKRESLLEEFARIDSLLRQLPLLQSQIQSQLGSLP